MSDLRLRGVVRSLGLSVHDLQKPLDWRGADRSHWQVLVSHVIAVDANYLHHSPDIGDGGSLVRDGELRTRFQVVYSDHGAPFKAASGWVSLRFVERLVGYTLIWMHRTQEGSLTEVPSRHDDVI